MSRGASLNPSCDRSSVSRSEFLLEAAAVKALIATLLSYLQLSTRTRGFTMFLVEFRGVVTATCVIALEFDLQILAELLQVTPRFVRGFRHGQRQQYSSPPTEARHLCPIPTFFLAETEDLDLQSFQSHVVRVAKAGVGPLLAGSMGEGIHLTHVERIALIRAARKALDDADLRHVPIIAGTGTGSTRETVELCLEAAQAGADYVIVIASGYFSGVLAGHKEALKAFWMDVSAKSPIPVIIYNYPGASAGIDLDSDLITELATNCPNLAGVKLTCGNVGKLTRICATVSDPSFSASHGRDPTIPFLVLGGFVDFIVPSAFANGHGAITGLANIAPHATMRLFELAEAAKDDLSFLPKAQRLQAIIARADFTIAKASIAGTKALLEKLYGYGGSPRRPLPPIDVDAAAQLWSTHIHRLWCHSNEKSAGSLD
ncbi:L-threo-3-deoxy-hexylosonate aldolase [Grifola frondosa]|uniref:L-threo-3-deoxy-hexylosonate aldolase n=1 Tax=Grifola frondosa TaxID=5627 RepID=A0A1C7MGG7_GRIFR|nr:L-threo-3-deoxy-hexylosonate aldolase [Grifola frondosa]